MRIALRLLAVLGCLVLVGAHRVGADGLLYKPGDIILAVQQYGGTNPFDGILAVDPATRAAPVIASGGLIQAPIGLSLDSNGDLLIVEDAVPTAMPALPARVIRTDGHTGAQSLVSNLPLDALEGGAIGTDHQSNPARIGTHLYVPTWLAVVDVNMATGEASTLSTGGLLDEGSGFATGEAASILLGSGVSSYLLIRVSLDTGQQSIAYNLGLQIYDAVMQGTVPILLTDPGVLELDPIQGPTLLYNNNRPNVPRASVTMLDILLDGSFVVDEPGPQGNLLYRLKDPLAPELLLDNTQPGSSGALEGFVVAPDTVPEPAGAQLVALLVLAALATPRSRKLAPNVTTVDL